MRFQKQVNTLHDQISCASSEANMIAGTRGQTVSVKIGRTSLHQFTGVVYLQQPSLGHAASWEMHLADLRQAAPIFWLCRYR